MRADDDRDSRRKAKSVSKKDGERRREGRRRPQTWTDRPNKKETSSSAARLDGGG